MKINYYKVNKTDQDVIHRYICIYFSDNQIVSGSWRWNEPLQENYTLKYSQFCIDFILKSMYGSSLVEDTNETQGEEVKVSKE